MTDIYASHDASGKSNDVNTTFNTNPINAGGNDSTGQHYAYFLFPSIPTVATTYVDGNLRLTVGTGTGDESAATFYVYRAQSTFDEASLTWSNKPALDASPIWSGAGFDTQGETHNIPIPAATINAAAGGDLVLAIHSQNVSDYVRFWSSEDALDSRKPMLTVTEQVPQAAYTLTITHTADSAAVANRTYEIDATASVGTSVTLTQTGGTTVSITESPTGVFTFADPGSGGDLVFDLAADTDTAVVTIPRLRGGPPLTYYGGGATDLSNWG